MTEQKFEYTPEMVEEVLDEMDFELIKRVMDAIDWQWRDEGVPTIAELRREGRRLLRDAIRTSASNEGVVTAGCGGLEAECDGIGWLKLRFVVCDWEVGLHDD